MPRQSTASVRTELVERIAMRAVEWVYDQGCTNTLRELEKACEALIRRPVHGDEWADEDAELKRILE